MIFEWFMTITIVFHLRPLQSHGKAAIPKICLFWSVGKCVAPRNVFFQTVGNLENRVALKTEIFYLFYFANQLKYKDQHPVIKWVPIQVSVLFSE